MTPSTDVIIPVRLTREFASADNYFMHCMDGLLKHTRSIRVIFVDDCSDEHGRSLVEMIARNLPDSLIVRTHKQRWFTRAVNLGLRLVNTPWVVVLNSDTLPHEGWLEELYSVSAEAAKISRVGLVGSVYSPEDPRRYITTPPPGYTTGHCWLLNMEAIWEVARSRGTPNDVLDPLRPDAIHIRSDVYLCYDLNKLNWLTVTSHHSHVDHEAGKSWGHQLHRIPSQLEAVIDNY